MELAVCKHGHHYDPTLFSHCPVCDAEMPVDAQDIGSWFHRIAFLQGCSHPEMLAAGSSSRVYRVIKNGITYALKVIDCGSDPVKLRNAEYEIFLMHRLGCCQGALHLVDSQILHHNGCAIVFLLEPYAVSFEEYYKKNDITVSQVLQLGIDICDALEQCWDAGVAHLDVQPKNLFVGGDGRFLLGDFGAGVPVELLGQERQLRGTLSYMAPEVYRNRDYSQASDTYALGMLLYCLINYGCLPFTDLLPKEHAVWKRLDGNRFQIPSEAGVFLGDCIQQATAYDPRQRFQSFQQMCSALKTAREKTPEALLYRSVKHAPAPQNTAPAASVPKQSTRGGFLAGLFRGKKEAPPSASSVPFSGAGGNLFDPEISGGMDSPVRGAPVGWSIADSCPQTLPSTIPIVAGNLFDADSFACTAPMEAPGAGNLFDADSFACTAPMAIPGAGNLFEADSFACTAPMAIPGAGNLFDADSFACTAPMEAPGAGNLFDADSFACTAPMEAPCPAPVYAPAPRMDQVQFSAVAPKEARKGEYTLIQLYMYEQAFRSVVEEALAAAEGPAQEKRSGFQKVLENTRVKVVLTCPDMPIDDNVQEQIWYGGYLQFDFAICPPEDFKKRQILLTAAVYFDDIPATRLMLMLKPLASCEEEIELSRQDIVKAFVSYASQDRIRVGALVQGMRKARPDMDIFFDVTTLHSGEDWEKTLYREILQRDILFLCWSRNARASAWVEREWRFALEHKGVDAIEPVPLEQPDICPPPQELFHKHFNDSLLYIINR